jgi:hypothetical protein
MVPKVTDRRDHLFSYNYGELPHGCAIESCKYMHTEPKRLRLGGNSKRVLHPSSRWKK